VRHSILDSFENLVRRMDPTAKRDSRAQEPAPEGESRRSRKPRVLAEEGMFLGRSWRQHFTSPREGPPFWPFLEPRCHFTRCLFDPALGLFSAGLDGTRREASDMRRFVLAATGFLAIAGLPCGQHLWAQAVPPPPPPVPQVTPQLNSPGPQLRIPQPPSTQPSAPSAATPPAVPESSSARCAAAAAFDQRTKRLAAPAQRQPHFGCAAGRELFLPSLHPAMHGYRPGILHRRSEDRQLLPGSVQAPGVQRPRLVPQRSIMAFRFRSAD
jgi:hypothetical protein